jgi:catechol 2,3-dioxygenase-like lactoylglutathione lyase family enzyme
VLCAAAFVLILIILSGNELDDTSGQAIGTAVAVAFLSLTAVAGSHLTLRQPQLSLFGYLTVGVSALALLITVVAIWSGFESDNWKPAIYCLIVAFACGHTSVLLSSQETDGRIGLVRMGTVAALWLLAVMAIVEISSPGNDVDPQGFGVLAVLYALGTVVLPLLRRSASGPRRLEQAQPPEQEQDELPLDHRCLVWPDTAESAVAQLRAHGFTIVKGPEPGSGAHGAGTSVFYRDPAGGLVELISYG